MVGDVADGGRVGLDALDLRVVGDLRELALGGLELGVVLDVGLVLGVLRQALHLGGVRHDRRLRLGDVPAREETCLWSA